jgi:hypothetical protein
MASCRWFTHKHLPSFLFLRHASCDLLAAATQAIPAGQPPHAVTACGFSPGSDLFAYATSYDGSRGDDPAMAARPNDVWLHATDESDLVAPAVAPAATTHSHSRGGRRGEGEGGR